MEPVAAGPSGAVGSGLRGLDKKGLWSQLIPDAVLYNAGPGTGSYVKSEGQALIKVEHHLNSTVLSEGYRRMTGNTSPSPQQGPPPR